MSKNLLMIFTRNPELGKVKTRLAKTIGDRSALNIYKFLLKHTLAITKDLSCYKAVYYSGKIRDNDIWNIATFNKKIQQGNDLGDRMQNAFSENLKKYDKVLIIGSDMYDIKPNHINKAFNKLNEHDVVIGPATDGGYYLLGLKSINKEIFTHKEWGTSTVLKNTLQDLKNLDVFLLEELNDIDVYDDIKNNKIFKQFLDN